MIHTGDILGEPIMAHAFRWKLDRTAHAWHVCDAITGATAATLEFGQFVPADIKPQGYIALAYGVKQLSTDGGAKEKGTSARVRLAATISRFNQWVNGTYKFRDGMGGSSGLDDGDVYLACVGIGRFRDVETNREKWKGLTAAQRAKLRTDPAIAAWLENNTPDVTDEDLAEVMAIFE